MIPLDFFIKGKFDEYKCEDSYCINDHFACVIDGATRQTDYLYEGCLTPGKLASILLKNAVTQLDFRASLEETVKYLSSILYAYYQKQGDIQPYISNKLIRAAASVALYSNYYREIWLIGDCQCYVDGKSYCNYSKIDRLAAQIRSLYLIIELESGKSMEELLMHDPGRRYILPILKNQVLFQNNKEYKQYSYSAIDGFPVDLTKIKKIHVKQGSQIILATDGYPKIFRTLHKTEEYLKYALKKDPLLIDLYKSTKGLYPKCQSYDDRTYLSFQIE